MQESVGRRLAESQQAEEPRQLLREQHPVAAASSRSMLWPAWAAVLVLFLAVLWFTFLKPKPESAADNEPAAPLAIQTSALFVIPPSGDVPERGFATLADAIAAARDGAVIECRFNGQQRVEMLRGNEKALVLRAGEGFAPVLVPATDGELILFTHAPLVLEGLTLFTQSMRPPGSGRRGDGNRGRGAIVIVEGAPILAAHCRIEVASNAPVELPSAAFLSLVSVAAARFVHCEFDCGEAFAMDWRARPRAESRESADHLRMQDSIAVGNLILVSFRGRQPLRLDLARNTLSGQSVLALRGPDPGQPLEVQASDNVFAVDMVANFVMRAGGAPIENLLRWQGQSNAYSFTTYADGRPSLNHYEDWLASIATSETNSVSTTLGIRRRLDTLTGRTRAAEAAALALTAEERQQLRAQGWTSTEPPGADPRKTGPGQPYHDWRKSPDYTKWLKLVREHIPQNAVNP